MQAEFNMVSSSDLNLGYVKEVRGKVIPVMLIRSQEEFCVISGHLCSILATVLVAQTVWAIAMSNVHE